MANTITVMWTIKAMIDNEGKQEIVYAYGPAENIYTALGSAKSQIARSFPKVDTATIQIHYILADPGAVIHDWTVLEESEVEKREE